MPYRLATIGIGSRSASRRITTICSSVNLDLRMLPSESEGSLSSNGWSEITGASHTGLGTTTFRLRRRLPCDRNYSVPGPLHRIQHRPLSASQLQDETRVLPFCSSHWNHKRPQNYFPLFTQDPCQHVKVVPISLGKLGAHWRATT